MQTDYVACSEPALEPPAPPGRGGLTILRGLMSQLVNFLPSILHYVTYVYNSIQCTLQPIIGLIQDFQVLSPYHDTVTDSHQMCFPTSKALECSKMRFFSQENR